MSILTVTEPRYYTHYTTTLALGGLAKERGLDFEQIWLDDFRLRRWPRAERPLVVVHAAHLKIARVTVSEVKSFYPGARVVTLGSDSIYYVRRYPDAHRGLLVDPRGWEYVRPEDVDLHLDLMQEVVDAKRAAGVPSERWWWTACRDGLQLARCIVEHEPEPDKSYHCVCFANPSVSAPGGYRPRLTRELARRGRIIRWGGTTDFVTLDGCVLADIYRLYRRAHTCLGTTSPSWTPCRTMKGWRDWFAPHLGVPLVYDDLPEIRAHAGPAVTGPPPVETFGYEDFDGLVELLERYDDPAMRSTQCQAQQTWAQDNVLEKQFTRLFDLYGLIT